MYYNLRNAMGYFRKKQTGGLRMEVPGVTEEIASRILFPGMR